MLTDEDKDTIIIMYKDGWNPENIAEELNLDETEVIDYCSEILGD